MRIIVLNQISLYLLLNFLLTFSNLSAQDMGKGRIEVVTNRVGIASEIKTAGCKDASCRYKGDDDVHELFRENLHKPREEVKLRFKGIEDVCLQ